MDRLIAEAEERRVEQMLHIAALLVEGESAMEVKEGLRQVEALLKQMRAQRVTEQSQNRGT